MLIFITRSLFFTCAGSNLRVLPKLQNERLFHNYSRFNRLRDNSTSKSIVKIAIKLNDGRQLIFGKQFLVLKLEVVKIALCVFVKISIFFLGGIDTIQPRQIGWSSLGLKGNLYCPKTRKVQKMSESPKTVQNECDKNFQKRKRRARVQLNARAAFRG